MSSTTSEPPYSQDRANDVPLNATELTLRLQEDLATLLQGITKIKQNCTKLETENKFIREYIASLMSQNQKN